MSGFTLAPTDRILLVGPTNSGKSTVLRAMAYSYRNLVVIDAKHEETVPRSIVVYTAGDFTRTFPQRSSRVTFRPNPELRDAEDVDAVIRRLMIYGRTALVIHDAMLYATPGTILPGYKRALILGRTVGVPVWSAIQRPVGVHNVVLSELTHLLVWPLKLDTDRAKLAGIVGPEAMIQPSRPFAFDYYGPSTGGQLAVTHCDPLEVPGASTDDRQPGAGDDHGNGRYLRDQSPDPNRQRTRPQRPGERDLARPPSSSPAVRPADGRAGPRTIRGR